MARTKEQAKRGPSNPSKSIEHASTDEIAQQSQHTRLDELLEEDVPQLVRKKKKPAKKPAPPKVTKPKPKKKPTAKQYYDALMRKTWVQTRWAHRETLETLGIFDDVWKISKGMGLKRFFFLQEPGYQELTCEFLSTLHYSIEEGEFSFQIGNEYLKWTTRGLSDLFGFPYGKKLKIPKITEEIKEVWEMIGEGKYASGIKATKIRHPAIRYVHKCLANTFFARAEPGKINKDDMFFIARGLKPTIKGTRNNEPIEDRLDLGGLLLLHLLDIRETLYDAKDSAKLMVGGIITPILKDFAKEGFTINFPPDEEPFATIDIAYLSTSRFLGGVVNSSYTYIMHNKRQFLLPNHSATTLDIEENLTFKPQDGFFDSKIHTSMWTSRAKGKAPQEESSSEEEESEEEENEPREDETQGESSRGNQEEVYGGHRYHFEPYDGVSSSRGMLYSHEKIKTLQMWNKWQDRTIHKLTKAVKGLKRQVKMLTSKLAGDGSSRTQQEEQVERIIIDGGRHSFGGTSNATMDVQPSRHSAYEPRKQRRRRRSPTPTSSNDSYSLNTEESAGFPAY